MQPSSASTLSQLLDKIAESLDIPDSLYEDAVVRYEDVAAWLTEERCPFACHNPRAYVQGSFRLGTVVRPITDADHYDIDLVCQLGLEKEKTTQADLKSLVGDRLKVRADLKAILTPSRRCWNLDYGENFHMDVLPCLQNLERKPDGILLTDTQLTRWQKSNPIAYANWFRDRMRVAFDQRRMILAKAMQADVEAVPEWQVRTPLQRAIQLLKRHRDLYFAKDLDNRPVSIIITTLAAQAYINQLDLMESLTAVIKSMPRFITQKDGRYIVQNPVEPDENFADKWNEKPTLRKAFMGWMERAERDFNALPNKTPAEAARLLMPMLGSGTLQMAAKGLGLSIEQRGFAVPNRAEPVVPALASASHVEKPHWPERLSGKVSVHGGIYLKKHHNKKLWDLSNRPLPKRVAIKFTAKTNVREPYTIKWQVVNTGNEALEVGQLRGDFYDGTGNARWEDTLYAGTHWVEAFVIKDGTCVARSGRILVRIKK